MTKTRSPSWGRETGRQCQPAVEDSPCRGCGQNPAICADISAGNQELRGLTLLILTFIRGVFCSVNAASPGAGAGVSRNSSVSQL